ncbi:MAG: polysaccharide export protein [Acidobacteriota bacterium]|nr:polysaccharide export protein [Acidobacteriota bacterium]
MAFLYRCRPAALLLLTAWLPLVAAAQTSDAAARYRLGPQDLLEITVLEDDTLNREVRVSEAGTIELPHIGAVRLQGLSAPQAATELEEALGQYLQRATVTLEILEYRAQPISVVGAVEKPGNLPFSGRWTLLQALTQAGGLADDHGEKILVLRRGATGLSDRLEIDAEDLLVHGDPTVNVPIFANDLINVPKAVSVTVYCLGEVSRPGAIVVEGGERVTVITALARAGGLGERASKKIRIQRSGRPEILININDIRKGQAEDIELMDGDVLWVKESFL